MPAQHKIFVCTTCASKWENGQRVGESGGEKLFNLLQEHHLTSSDVKLTPESASKEVIIEAVQCMSACSHSCVVSFAAPGKYTYLFGGLSPELTPQELANVFDCANKYYNHSEGLLPWGERPEPLKKGILARIPAISPS
jgi:predicted metal-binding protein